MSIRINFFSHSASHSCFPPWIDILIGVGFLPHGNGFNLVIRKSPCFESCSCVHLLFHFLLWETRGVLSTSDSMVVCAFPRSSLIVEDGVCSPLSPFHPWLLPYSREANLWIFRWIYLTSWDKWTFTRSLMWKHLSLLLKNFATLTILVKVNAVNIKFLKIHILTICVTKIIGVK